MVAASVTAALWAAPGSAQESVALPTIDVISNTPLPGSGIDRDKIPSNVQTVPSADFDHAVAPGLVAAMTRTLPGVAPGDQTGNPFQLSFDYRGFTASPVLGSPQGLATYQNGTRINEVFGDTVNWDFIPEMAIQQMTLAPSNPVYGLNATGGALSIEMKNGFTYQGAKAEARVGSYGRLGTAAEAGGQQGNLAGYVAADIVNDAGWRDSSSSSKLRRIYLDLGARGEQTEFHLSFTGADNSLGSVAATPVEMLNARWSSVYTWPQTARNQLAFLQANANYTPSDTLSIRANAYFRSFRQSRIDGNTTDAQPCAAPGLLCFGSDTTPLLDGSSRQLANIFGANLGEIDRTWTNANSLGATVQATYTADIFGHSNNFVLGASIDDGRVHFTGNSELGIIDPALFVKGTGVLMQQPDADLAPVDLRSTSTYLGLYVSDTFDVTDRLSVTAGGRFNLAFIKLDDQLGSALDGASSYRRFNPVAGFAYKVTPGLTVYGGYSEASRAPTPLELGCADPARPCLIDYFLVADPPLNMVVSHTYEVGLRGTLGDSGELKWSVGLYRTDTEDDIINVASQISGFGFFQNAATTRRQGFEASATYRRGRWNAYANYTFVDATFQSRLGLSSPANPFANEDGTIFVVPGDHMPAIPAHRFKAGAAYSLTEAWTLGADLTFIGSQYLIGDQSNQNPQVPAYWTVNLRSSYRIAKNIELFGLVQNLFNRRYYAAGAFFETDALPFRSFSDARTFIPGMPLAIYAGARATF